MDIIDTALWLAIGYGGYYAYQRYGSQLGGLFVPGPATGTPPLTDGPGASDLPSVIGTVIIDRGPIALAADESSVYAANNAGNNGVGGFSIVNRADLSVRNFGAGVWYPLGCAVNSLTHRLYVTNNQNDAMTVISTGNPADYHHIVVGPVCKGVAVNRNTNRIYVARHGLDHVAIVDGATEQIVAEPTVQGLPAFVAVDEYSNRCYSTSWDIGNAANQVVTCIDGNSHQVLWAAKVAGEPLGITVHPSTHNVLVTSNTGGNGVVSILNRDGGIVAQVSLGRRLSGIAVGQSGKVYVSDTSGLFVLTPDLAILTKLDTGGTPDIGLCASGQYVYVGNILQNTLAIIEDK